MSTSPHPGRRWVATGFWAVLDQGLFATTNFAVTVLMARWLEAEAFGAFSVAYSVYLLVATLHTALLTEPMLVFGPATQPEERGHYLRALTQAHSGVAVVLTALLAGGAFIALAVGERSMAAALGGLSLGVSWMLLLWLARRSCYMRMEPRAAAVGGFAYLALTAVMGALLQRGGYLNEFSVFVLMGAVAAAVGSFLLRGRITGSLFDGAGLRERLRPHTAYARWAVATSGLTWVPANLPYFVLPVWGGLSGSAEFRALSTIAMPMIQTNYALGQMLLPAFARDRRDARLNSRVRAAFAGTVCLSVLFWLVSVLAGGPLLDWLYAGRYSSVASHIWLIGALPVLTGIVTVQQALLRAHVRPRPVFWAYAAAAATSLTVGTFLTYAFDVRGAVWGVLAAYGVLAAILWRVSRTDGVERQAGQGA